MSRSSLPGIALVLACYVLVAPATAAEDCCDPDSPFAPGEGHVAVPATCETMAFWLDRAPDAPGRITMAIEGELTAVGADDALAYLIMCRPHEIQVMCVTYSVGDFEPGDVAVFAGGFIRAGDRRIMLDPCLASPAD